MEPGEHQKPKRIELDTENPREAAYLALLLSLREETYVGETLERWRKKASPSSVDYHLAREIAYGASRMALALDYVAEQLANKQKLNLKLRERVLMRTAVYQHMYMDRVPDYAISDETIEIAKKYCHETFVRFLNAALRRLSENAIELPKGETVPEISIRYSYPPFYVQELIQNYGLEKAETYMEAGNKPSVTMFRIRPHAKEEIEKREGIELLAGTLSPIAMVRDTRLLPTIVESPDYYIQNVTPAVSIQLLSKKAHVPNRVLDMCASPGGKLIAVHDNFPDAELFANDVSPEKLKPLSENCAKYNISATLSCSRGQEYSSDTPFDLVILDAPCSNSGVLNKRPEARWRISRKNLEQLEEMQLQLLKNAVSLISEHGEIWYLTCSILKRENTRLVDKACEMFNLQVRTKETIFPNLDGWDGGFACALQKV
ncbi:MAG: Ribosomal RNA small subunit methyltransferase B [Chlamydiae bacterium]|nr:Ribosomal RNA small subunit methyltransferase B [Chlamydiota bacterium]